MTKIEKKLEPKQKQKSCIPLKRGIKSVHLGNCTIFMKMGNVFKLGEIIASKCNKKYLEGGLG